MNDKYIPALTMLLAGSITSVMCIVMKRNVLQSLILLFVVMVLFYIIGLIARTIIRKVMDSYQKQQEEIEEARKKESEEDVNVDEEEVESDSKESE